MGMFRRGGRLCPPKEYGKDRGTDTPRALVPLRFTAPVVRPYKKGRREFCASFLLYILLGINQRAVLLHGEVQMGAHGGLGGSGAHIAHNVTGL